MSIQTSLVAEQVRLQQWAAQIQECKNRPANMKVETWCSEHGITKANYYYRLRRVRKVQRKLPETPKKKRGRKKKGKILALIERLEHYKASVCLFANDISGPFDNNQAERDIRMVKVKTKVSGCFRTEDGARDYLKIMSYVGTAHKHGFNAYEAIKNAFSETPEFIFG